MVNIVNIGSSQVPPQPLCSTSAAHAKAMHVHVMTNDSNHPSTISRCTVADIEQNLSKRAPQPRYGLGRRPFRLDLESLRGRAPCPNEHHHKSKSKNHLLVVDLVVLWNLDFSDPNYNHVGVDMNSAKLAAVATVGY
ncbi:lectin protein kinase family protein [Striga asiatica]|uniref:Lectin protein kinase family protein n=1 Tax=Striga asiatica TaxID=4170 RepID=A0A5A7PU39_STRAF|nr:lectin protein kinase family protein [Striga asiatica]